MPRDASSPFTVEPDGTYITIAQMKFFLNSTKGEQAWHERKEAFVKYYNMCRIYNLVSEVVLVDPKAAITYWDPVKENVSIAFPVDGCIAQAIRGMKILKETDYGYDFGGGHWTL
tara:strand:+ start:3857 stop:4201 length:345 start_codon:yes stop_codon:yes gene_type:complete